MKSKEYWSDTNFINSLHDWYNSMHQELLVKVTRDKENKKSTKNQTQQVSGSSHLKKRDGQKIKSQVKTPVTIRQ